MSSARSLWASWGASRAQTPAARVFGWATLGWMIGWYVKLGSNLTLAGQALYAPLHHPHFQGWRADHGTLLLILALPAATLPLVWLGRRRFLIVSALVYMLCAWAGLMHQMTFNDATFVTSFWASLWLLWLAVSSDEPDPHQEQPLAQRARRFAMMIVSLMFLGGFVGKLTPEYWSGLMFYHYFFLDRDILHYPWLRQVLSAEQLRALATWFSRWVVIMEGAMMLAFLAPFRKVAPVAIVCMLSIVAGSTPWLTSVFGSMVGMVLANYAWPRSPKR